MTLEERIAHLQFAESSPENRALFLAMVMDAEEGDAFFINVCGMTYDPRRDQDGNIIGPTPFLLWPKQEEAAREFGKAMDNSYDAGGEKSRDVGFTWIVLFCIVKRWLFVPGFSALIGHYIDELLDSDDDSSLFWRIDFIIKHLPPWMLPKGFNRESKDWRAYGKLLNAPINSAITGAAPTLRFGVGARKSVVYFDDWARWEFGRQAYNSSAAVTQCRITTWTVNPDDPMNHAYELRYGKGSFLNTKTRIITCSWKDDPRKMRLGPHPLTAEQCNLWLLETLGDPKAGIAGRISQQTFDREYGMLYEIAVSGQIYAEQMPYARLGKFPWDPRFPLYSVVDPGVGDECVILWIQWDWEQYRYRLIDCYHANGYGAAYYLPILKGKKDENEQLPHEADYDDEARAHIKRKTSWQQLNRYEQEWRVKYEDHFGDPAIKSRGASDGKSFKDVMREGDITIHSADGRMAQFKDRIEESRRVIRFLDIDEERCEYVIRCLRNYRWGKNEKPEHDSNSHAASAFQYFCVNDPHKEEFMERAASMATGRASKDIGAFGDISALPRDLQRQLLKEQQDINAPFRLGRPDRSNRDAYMPPPAGGPYGMRR